MNYNYKIVIAVLSALILSACGESSLEVYEEYSSEIYVTAPELVSIGLLDSYGNHSDFDPNYLLTISPYINHGVFDIFWEVISNKSYIVDVRINNFDGIVGSQRLFTDICDPYYSDCFQEQMLLCDYDSHFDIACAEPNGETQVANIGHLVNQIPQSLYLIVDICNEFGEFCHYMSIPVSVE